MASFICVLSIDICHNAVELIQAFVYDAKKLIFYLISSNFVRMSEDKGVFAASVTDHVQDCTVLQKHIGLIHTGNQRFVVYQRRYTEALGMLARHVVLDCRKVDGRVSIAGCRQHTRCPLSDQVRIKSIANDHSELGLRE